MSMNKLQVSKIIFKKRSLLRAIEAYSNISKITYSEKDEYWLLVFFNCLYGIDRTIHEFENYLICVEATDGDNHGSM